MAYLTREQMEEIERTATDECEAGRKAREAGLCPGCDRGDKETSGRSQPEFHPVAVADPE